MNTKRSPKKALVKRTTSSLAKINRLARLPRQPMSGYTLAINTSTKLESVALLAGRRLLKEIMWIGRKDESEKLLANIEKVLHSASASFQDLKEIIVISGPGPFSAVRIGVTVANMLAFLTGATLYKLNSLDYWKSIAPEKNATLLVNAGGPFICIKRPGTKFEITKFTPEVLNGLYFGDLTNDQMAIFKNATPKNTKFIMEKKLLTFGAALEKINKKLLKRCKIAEPEYFRPPNITINNKK